jgi:hypothetical protein
MKSSKFLNFGAIFGIFIFIYLVIYLHTEFNSPQRNEELLKSRGYSSIHIGDFNYLCERGTPMRRYFKAINNKGQEVNGSICAGNLIHSDEINIEIIIKK